MITIFQKSLSFAKKNLIYILLAGFPTIIAGNFVLYLFLTPVNIIPHPYPLLIIIFLKYILYFYLLVFFQGLILLYMENNDIFSLHFIKKLFYKSPKLLLMHVIGLLLTSIGFLFLIIPGFLILPLLIMLVPIAITKDLSVGNIFKESIALGKENYRLFLVLFASILIIYSSFRFILNQMFSGLTFNGWFNFINQSSLAFLLTIIISVAFIKARNNSYSNDW